MIKKTVYFRSQETLDKFNAIKNKAEWFDKQLDSGDDAEDLSRDTTEPIEDAA